MLDVDCRVSSDGIVISDGEQFPFGYFNSGLCSCNTAPYEIRFGDNVVFEGQTYYTFRLFPRPCDESIMMYGKPICSSLRSVVNKIAFRLTNSSATCFNDTRPLPTLDKAENARVVRFWNDTARRPEPWLPARVGMTYSGKSVELYVYGLKYSYDWGYFMVLACRNAPSFASVCKRTAQNLCLYAFVDTPGHKYVSVCRTQGLI
ncbi:hypothetical protein GPECTOR_3g241 [Gonium pectorale]|uniref:Pherophorin domain-containing protein n=1 Tax=Gonium pectorale TaxID=33097 RepID=A0A150GYV2_GONPE|nr:hypothetical protein GPECTOR_3g241 [Gonium pectorale]|eukprot:KXZ55086.1 hypothetical protein GPECTOR_3g241 [Gonium pectorale]